MNRRQFNLGLTAIMLSLSAIPKRLSANPQLDGQKSDRPATPSGAMHSSYFFQHPTFEYEAFWPGQSRQLYDLLASPKKLIPFSESDGADLHCEPKGTGLRDLRVFNWLDETLA